MKKMIFKAAMVAALFAVGTVSADAQFSDLLNKAKSAVSTAASKAKSSASSAASSATSKVSSSTSTSGSSILSTIGSIFSSKLVPSETQIVGTWVYQEPAIVLTSSNTLTSAAGSVATKTIETKLKSYLAMAGIKKGSASLTFNSDKSFSFNYGTKKITGTYTIADEKVSLTFTGRTTASKLTPQLNNGTLIIAADATTIKTFMQNIGSKSSNSTITTITNLLKSFDGMQVGMRLEKQ